MPATEPSVEPPIEPAELSPADRVTWQALRAWLQRDEEGRAMLARIAADPAGAAEALDGWLRARASQAPPELATYISGGQVGKIINIAQAGVVQLQVLNTAAGWQGQRDPSLLPPRDLDELERASRARCIKRWLAAGVPWPVAAELADDPAVGAPSTEMRPGPEKPVVVLLGEMGLGKSLLAERMLQDAVRQARSDASAPIPVYLEAWQAVQGLQQAVEGAAAGLGNLRVRGVAIVINDADRGDIEAAADLLYAARELVSAWPSTTAVLTARPHPVLAEMAGGVYKEVRVPLLTVAEADALVSRFAKRPVRVADGAGWPKSVRNAVRRPLFAILLGTHLHAQSWSSAHSTADLLSSLVERALGWGQANRASADLLLRRLAVLSIDRGGPVPASEVGTRNELTPLLESQLVVEELGALAFPLPILAEWFAAQRLGSGVPSATELVADPQRLERWRYPLITAAGTLRHEQVSAVLAPLAERCRPAPQSRSWLRSFLGGRRGRRERQRAGVRDRQRLERVPLGGREHARPRPHPAHRLRGRGLLRRLLRVFLRVVACVFDGVPTGSRGARHRVGTGGEDIVPRVHSVHPSWCGVDDVGGGIDHRTGHRPPIVHRYMGRRSWGPVGGDAVDGVDDLFPRLFSRVFLPGARAPGAAGGAGTRPLRGRRK